MRYRKLGRTGVNVSEICLGAMTFGMADATSFMHGMTIDVPTSFAVMDRAVELGINFFDTANVYGQAGLSEQVVGEWLAARNCRDKIVLASKFRRRAWPGPNGASASRYHIRKAVEDSLRRLRTDHIDLYQVHCQDSATPEDETLRALDDLVRQGKVLYLGASNYAAHRLVRALWISDVDKLERYCVLQQQYNLILRETEREHLPACREHGVGLTVWGPLAAGFLSGIYKRGQPPPPGSRLGLNERRFKEVSTERAWNIIEEVERVAAEHDATPAQISLAWLLSRAGVSSCIVGVCSIAELDEDVGAVGLELSAEQLARLERVSAWERGVTYDFIDYMESQ